MKIRSGYFNMRHNSDICIRHFRDSDEKQVFLIESEVFRERNAMEYVYFYATFMSGYFVCEWRGFVCAFIVGYPLSDSEGHIFSLAVRKEFRNKGIATALLLRLCRHFYSYGLTKVSLEVRVGNIPAIRLYQKHGFSLLWTEKHYYSDGEDGYAMMADLNKMAHEKNFYMKEKIDQPPVFKLYEFCRDRRRRENSR